MEGGKQGAVTPGIHQSFYQLNAFYVFYPFQILICLFHFALFFSEEILAEMEMACARPIQVECPQMTKDACLCVRHAWVY